ncbi:Receptor-type tyrosine-protein phosphatase alpha-like [Oopsacas minuta]|uniref:protein-tyrosine-phosphatase n=1 Tax=Oopsacas minuta TaxID=111878 RepID=A0AAV7JL73_9METZ|nr:Receptor-type tyrosine-protein phosphatase alpha-like [Oopsacas minuta]
MPEISSFLNFHTIVSSFYKSQKQSGPLLVHCRSGAGASAVFIFLDILRTQAHAENQIDIHRCITTMRSMRSRMVCSMEYYIYAHDLLLASLICGNTCIDAPSYPHRIKKLSEVDSRTHATGYNTEYITLDQISNSPQDYPHTLAQENPTMNRKIEFLPIDSRCVSLSHGEYINATFVNGYERENAFIIAESPLINTVGRFWQLIFEHRCRAVITLCDLTQDQQEVGAKYWMESGEPVTYRDLTVQLSNIIHPEHGAYTIHTFMLTSARIKVIHTFSLFNYRLIKFW